MHCSYCNRVLSHRHNKICLNKSTKSHLPAPYHSIGINVQFRRRLVWGLYGHVDLYTNDPGDLQARMTRVGSGPGLQLTKVSQQNSVTLVQKDVCTAKPKIALNTWYHWFFISPKWINICEMYVLWCRELKQWQAKCLCYNFQYHPHWWPDDTRSQCVYRYIRDRMT